ncbi:hypothetical protein C0R02_21000 [Streptomyces albidoflavus]|nr:hypothetical protein C0R02_21000 [Streptomyces albidoflavus]
MDAVIGREAVRFPRVARSPAGSSEGPPGPGEAGVLVAAHGHGADATAASATAGVDTIEHRTAPGGYRAGLRVPGVPLPPPVPVPRGRQPGSSAERGVRRAGGGRGLPAVEPTGCGRRRRSP